MDEYIYYYRCQARSLYFTLPVFVYSACSLKVTKPPDRRLDLTCSINCFIRSLLQHNSFAVLIAIALILEDIGVKILLIACDRRENVLKIKNVDRHVERHAAVV